MQISEYIDNFSKEMHNAYGFNLCNIRFHKEAAICKFLSENTKYKFEPEVSLEDESNIIPSINVVENDKYLCNILIEEAKAPSSKQKAYKFVIESKYCDGIINKNPISTTEGLLEFFNLCVAALSY